MKRRLIQLGIFLIGFLIIELALRAFGNKPGTLNSNIYPTDSLVSAQIYKADANGITSYIKESEFLPEGYHINNQGFRSPIDFTKQVIDSIRMLNNQKVVLLIGDSYTEGCCASPIDSSFADLMYNDQNYILLNFGVGATGLSQYELIVENYLEKISPDLVVIAFYLGNDILYQKRPKTPYVPVCFQIKDYNWLNSVGPPYHMISYENDFFKTKEESYEFYLSRYTLWSEKANQFEIIIRNSVLLSKLFLGGKDKLTQIKWGVNNHVSGNEIILTNTILKTINEKCKDNGAEMLVLGIPSPKDVKQQINLEEKYGIYFEGIDCRFPLTALFSTKDFDGMGTSNHFINSGHRKCYQFMKHEIEGSLNTD